MSQEWLIITYVVNVAKEAVPAFYIFKSSQMKEDYIKLYKTRSCMAMQNKVWMITYLFNQWLTFFWRFVIGEIFQ